MREYIPAMLPRAKDTIRLDAIPPFDIEDYDLTKSKNLTKFFYAVERICRQSWCYQRMIEFLREYSDMRKCAFYKNTNNIDTTGIHIHVHHEPFTLFDIVSTVYAKRLACNESIDEEDIASEVMWNHYRMVVGLIPLSETVHELVHNGFLFIPTYCPFGYYKKFYIDYEPYIDRELKRVLNSNEAYSMKYNFEKESGVLKVHSVYIDPTGSYSFPKTDDIVAMLRAKIAEYDSNLSEQQAKAMMPTEDGEMQAFPPPPLKIIVDKVERPNRRMIG